MKRVAFLCLLTVLSSLVLSSCRMAPDAYDMLRDFSLAYGVEGVIYSPAVLEGDDGYIDSELFEKIYSQDTMPENFAVILNSRADYGAECGVFVFETESERTAAMEMCEERLRLISRTGDSALLIRTASTVFYSTLADKETAERVWRKIISSHT